MLADILLVDIGRFFGLTIFALIFFSWVVIMGRSFCDYRRAKRRGANGDADLRLHIWLITLSYLIFVGSTAAEMVSLIGMPLNPYVLPPMIIGGPIGLYALWLFLRPRRKQTIKPDDRTTTIEHN